MKKILLLSCLVAFAFMTNAQKRDNSSADGMPEKLNCVKLNLIGLAYKNIALQYERVLGPKISVACQLRYTLSGNLPFSGPVSNAGGDDSVFSDLKMGGWAVTPEFRFYPRHAMKGFYLAPYLRFRNISMDLPFTYTDDNNKSQSVLADGKFFSYGGGLMIGSHFNLGKSMSLDWFIIGLQYMNTNASFNANSTQSLSANDQAELNADLAEIKSDFKSFFKKMEYKVTSNSLSIDGKFGSVGLRGFGLNLGYRF